MPDLGCAAIGSAGRGIRNLSICHKSAEKSSRNGKGKAKRIKSGANALRDGCDSDRYRFCGRILFPLAAGTIRNWTLSPSALPPSKPKCTARFGARIARIRKRSSVRLFSTRHILNAESKVLRAFKRCARKRGLNGFLRGSSPMVHESRASTSCNSWAIKPDAACHDGNRAARFSVDCCSGIGWNRGVVRFSATSLRHFADELL